MVQEYRNIYQISRERTSLTQEKASELMNISIDSLRDSEECTYFTTYFDPKDNHNEYLEIYTILNGKVIKSEKFALKHRQERRNYLDYMKKQGYLSESEYKECLLTNGSGT